MKLNTIYSEITTRLEEVCENPSFEAKELIKHICSLNETEFLLGRNNEISVDVTDKIFSLAEKRLKGIPLQYIIGEWDFMGRTFKVGEGVLIPRPETEILCQYVVDMLKGKLSPRVYDLCSGSGCIAISIKLDTPDADVYAVEKSKDAYFYLDTNNKSLCSGSAVTLINGDIFNVDEFKKLPKADVIVSNPPYINSDEISGLQKEVQHEPVMALDGGSDGLDFYRFIITEWKCLLKDDGIFAFECGENQADAISDILKINGFDSLVIKDYNDIDRIVIGRR